LGCVPYRWKEWQTEKRKEMKQYLESNRVRLVKFTERHITASYLHWLNDHMVNRYMFTGRFPVTQEEVDVPSDNCNLRFAIMSKVEADGKPISESYRSNYIGTISLHNIDWIIRRAEVGYMVGDPTFWGKGLSTEAVGLVTDYGFNRLNLNKITAGVVKGNEGSVQVLVKNGYKQYATEPQDYYLEGEYLDAERFYKLQEWHNA